MYDISLLNEEDEVVAQPIIDKLDIALSKLQRLEELFSFISNQMDSFEEYKPMSADSLAFFKNNKNGFEALISKDRTNQLFDRVISPSLIDKANHVSLDETKEIVNTKLSEIRGLISRIENDGRDIQSSGDVSTEQETEGTPDVTTEVNQIDYEKLLSKFKKSLQQYVKKSFTTDVETIAKLNKNIIDAALSNYSDEEKDAIRSIIYK